MSAFICADCGFTFANIVRKVSHKCEAKLNHPKEASHYKQGNIECKDAMRDIATKAEWEAHCRLTAFKYLWRLGAKGPAAADAKKAEDYVRWLKESLNE